MTNENILIICKNALLPYEGGKEAFQRIKRGMTEVIKVEDCGENIGDYDVPIYKAILIPKNATNGDVIKAMFPNTSIHYHKADELVDDYVSVNIMGCDTQQDYSAEWWNAKYKAESEKV